MRILFFDTERAPPIWWAWESTKEQFLNYSQLIQNGFFTSIQWQWEWEENPSAYSITDNEGYFRENPTCDYHVCKRASDLLDKADLVVAHNGKRFDWRHLKAKLILHKLKPIRKPYIIDTLQEARTSAFPSNSLASLAHLLKIAEKGKNDADHGKMVTGPITQRIDEIKKQTEYGLKDIPPLKDLYYRLRPYMERHPHMGIGKGEITCPHCGGTNYQRRGESYLATISSFKEWYYCKPCDRKFPGKIIMRAK